MSSNEIQLLRESPRIIEVERHEASVIVETHSADITLLSEPQTDIKIDAISQAMSILIDRADSEVILEFDGIVQEVEKDTSRVLLTAGENIAANSIVAVVGGLAYLADHLNPLHAGAVVGIARQSVLAGAELEVSVSGDVEEPAWAWTGRFLFVGNSGSYLQSRPTTGFVQRVGRVLTPQSFLIDIDEAVICNG